MIIMSMKIINCFYLKLLFYPGEILKNRARIAYELIFGLTNYFTLFSAFCAVV